MNHNPQPGDEFWRGKRCLITGADGFVATNLASRLIQSGAMVYGVVRNHQRPVSMLDVFNIRSQMTVFPCDVRNFRCLMDIIASENVDTVFHLAATSTIGVAARSPLATLETNFLGTANVLEACRNVGVARIVVASTDKAYGDHRHELPLREDYSLRGLNIYDCSKSATDLISQTYCFQYQMPVRITRCCNIFGPGDQNFSRLVPGTIARLMEEIPPIIRPGQSDAKRQYLFIADAINAYLQVAKSITENDDWELPSTGDKAYSYCAFNIGSSMDHVKTTKEIIYSLVDLMHSNVSPEEPPASSAKNEETPNHQFLDSEKIKNQLGWRAEYDLEAGLNETITWYQQNRDILKPLYDAEIMGRRLTRSQTGNA